MDQRGQGEQEKEQRGEEQATWEGFAAGVFME